MQHHTSELWKRYLSKVQLNLIVAAHTKVSKSWHDKGRTPEYNRFYYIEEGEGYVRVGHQEFYPKPGELYLLPAHEHHGYGTISPNTFQKYWCHFTATIDQIPLFRLIECTYSVKISDPMRLKALFEQLIQWQYSNHFTAGMRIQALLLEMIAIFLEGLDTVQLNDRKDGTIEKVQAVIKYIEEHLSQNLTLEEIAKIAHFHPNYLIRLFKETTGRSPIQFVNQLRMEKAKTLLASTSWSITEVAGELGMENSYFSRMFKDWTGLTPSEYRELLPRNA